MTRTAGNLTVACITLALCWGMLVTKPHYADLIAPIPVDGSQNDTVAARSFDIHVENVTFAQALEADRFGEQKLLTTGGVWAVVAATLSATADSTSIGEAVWQGPSGLRYRMSERLSFSSDLPPHVVEPGLPKRGMFVFEVPPGQIRDATLLVSARRFAPLDSEVRIRLDVVPMGPDGRPQGIVPVLEFGKPGQGR